MRSRLPLPWAALAALLTALPAQDATTTAPSAQSIAKAKKDLRSKSKERQLDALKALAASSSDTAAWQDLGIARIVAQAFSSSHRQVVRTAITTLDKCPDRDAAMQLIAAHVTKLSKSVRGARQPKWPKTTGLGFSIPLFPPLPQFNPTAKQKREHKKRLAEYKRKQAAAAKKEAHDKLIRTKAFKDDAKLIAAAKELPSFAGHLTKVRSDAVTDALVGAYGITMKKDAVQVGPIAKALITSHRRDAVAACISAVTDSKDMDAARQRSRARFVNGQAAATEQRIKDRKAGRKTKPNNQMIGNILAVTQVTKSIREQLEALGKQFGVEIEHPKLSDAEMKVIMSKDKAAKDRINARLDRETLAAWRAWLKKLSPHLLEKTGT